MSEILLVDDELGGAEAVSLYLQRCGFEVTMAQSCHSALHALTADENTPDLILLDVWMPQMDGMEFLAIIRSYRRCQHLPVILLSAYADLPTVERTAARLGADVVNKAGIDLQALVELIRTRTGMPPPADPHSRYCM
jgi:CheY-like chemotaxis protein